MMLTLATISAAYLLGCFTTGYYLVRFLRGQDIREAASGNVGSRNVGRLLGARGFILTLAGDAGKGMAAVWLAHHLSSDTSLAMAALTAATIGHIWPLQLGFRGGKGFATLSGGMLLLAPSVLMAGLILAILFYIVLPGTTTIAGLLALACSPAIMAYRHIQDGRPLLSADLALYCLLVLLVLYAHRSNIRQAFSGRLP